MENPRPRQLWFDYQTSQPADYLTKNPKSMRCLSRLLFRCASFFMSWRDYTVKKLQPLKKAGVFLVGII